VLRGDPANAAVNLKDGYRVLLYGRAIEPYAIRVVGLHHADLRKRKREGPLRAKALFRPDLSEQGSKRFGLWSLLRVNLSAERRKHGGCNGELCGHLPNILPCSDARIVALYESVTTHVEIPNSFD